MVLKANPASVPRAERIISRADCASGVVGEAVRITGAAIGNKLQVARLDVMVSSDPPFAAMIIKDMGGGECLVQSHGPMVDILTGLTPGAVYFVDFDGTLSATPTVASHPVGQAFSDNILLIDPASSALDPRIPDPTRVAHLLYSENGADWLSRLPVTTRFGWMVNNKGTLLVR